MADKEVKKEEIVKVAKGKVRDDCCYEIDPTEFYRLLTLNSSDNEDDDEDDEVVLVSQKGQVALRDFPHPRYLCANFPFKSTSHERYCSKCFCYVCEQSAPCCQWKGSSGHCHATERGVFAGSEDDTSVYADSEDDALYYVDSEDEY